MNCLYCKHRENITYLIPRFLIAANCSTVYSVCKEKLDVVHNWQLFVPWLAIHSHYICLIPGGRGTSLPELYRYIRPQMVCFLAVLVGNRVSISATLVSNRVSLLHSNLELGLHFRKSCLR